MRKYSWQLQSSLMKLVRQSQLVTSSTTHSVFPLPSASTSAGCASLPGRVPQTFIPEGPLVVLPWLGCCNSPLTLIPGHGNTERRPKWSPRFQTCSFLPPLWRSSLISPCQSGSIIPVSTVTSLPVISEAWGAQSEQATVLTSSSMESYLLAEIFPFGTKITKPAGHKFLGTRSKKFASGALGLIVSGGFPFPLLDPWTHESWL